MEDEKMKTFAMFGVIVMVLGAFAGLAHGMGPMDGINPKADSDKDGLVNAQEYLWGTDPNDPDSDADGCYDGWEAWYDAHRATDKNGVAFMDAKYHFDPNSEVDAGKVADMHNLIQVRDGDANVLTTDPDNDGWNNLHEFLVGSDPTNPNTDGDIYTQDSADPDPLVSNGAGETGGGNGGGGSGIGEALAFV
jgi:hypothetical protein